MSSGSLSSVAPRSMAAVASPSNVSRRPEPAAMAGPASRSATCAPPIASGSVPYWLLNRTRTREPPMLVCTTCRTVWSAMRRGASPCSAASSPGGGSDTGPVAQVPIQRASWASATAGAAPSHTTSNAAAAHATSPRTGSRPTDVGRNLISPPVRSPRSGCRAPRRGASAGWPWYSGESYQARNASRVGNSTITVRGRSTVPSTTSGVSSNATMRPPWAPMVGIAFSTYCASTSGFSMRPCATT